MTGPAASFDDDEVGLALIESALDLLAEGGHNEFSLRRVAELVGASGSAASHRFGDRAGLIAAVCAAALQREQREMQVFAAKLPALPPAADPLAGALYEWMDQRTRWGRRQTRAVCELLLMAYRDPAAKGFSAAYLGLHRDFVRGLSPDLDPMTAERLTLYLISETPYWLVLADDTTFRLQSAETARRMIDPGVGALFWLEQGVRRDETLARPPPAPLTGTKRKIAEAVASIIARDGARAVTHRAISGLAGVSLSSLGHHFGNRAELVRVGILQWLTALSEPGIDIWDAPLSREIALAPYEVALQALGDPLLAPLTALLRRQQGALAYRASGGEGGMQARGRLEAASLLSTAMVLTGGENEQPLAERLAALAG